MHAHIYLHVSSKWLRYRQDKFTWLEKTATYRCHVFSSKDPLLDTYGFGYYNIQTCIELLIIDIANYPTNLILSKLTSASLMTVLND